MHTVYPYHGIVGIAQVNYVIIVSPFIVILISIFKFKFIFLLEAHQKRSEFETPTNATNCRVCFHPISHSINSKHEAFGPPLMGLMEGTRAGKVGRMGVGRD